MRLPADHAFGNKLPSVTDLTSLTGDFWYRFFEGRTQLEAINGGFQQEVRQFLRELHELAAAGGFETVPQYHTETFWPVLVSPSDVSRVPIAYGDGYFYGGQGTSVVPVSNQLRAGFGHYLTYDLTRPQIFYGDTLQQWWQIPLPQSLRYASGVSDETIQANTWFTVGLDSYIVKKKDTHYLEMPADPKTVFRLINDQYGEEKYLVWLYMAEFERYITANRYGVICDTYLPSTTSYIAGMKAVMRAYTSGGSELRLRELLAASVGEEVARLGEVVETVLVDRETPVVITDQRTIHGAINKTVAVAVGDVLDAGDFFFDSVKLTAFEDGLPPWMSSMIFPAALTGLAEDTVLPAGELPLTAETKNGYTYVSFSEGSAEFWDWINGPSGEFAAFLATDMGLRALSSGTIAPSNFPATWDVLAALSRSPLRYSISVSEIDSRFLVSDAVPLLQLVREVVPPWITHITQFDGNPPKGWVINNECGIRTVWM